MSVPFPIEIPQDSEFAYNNIPFGIFSTATPENGQKVSDQSPSLVALVPFPTSDKRDVDEE